MSQRRPSDALTASPGPPRTAARARRALARSLSLSPIFVRANEQGQRPPAIRRKQAAAARRCAAPAVRAVPREKSGASDPSFEDRHEPHARGRGRMGTRMSSVWDLLDVLGMPDGVIALPTRLDLKAPVKRESL